VLSQNQLDENFIEDGKIEKNLIEFFIMIARKSSTCSFQFNFGILFALDSLSLPGYFSLPTKKSF
jgi:hypothetical protein